MKTSTNELTALFATSTAAFTLALAASPIASWALGVRVPSLPLPPSVSFSIVYLLSYLCKRHTESRQRSIAAAPKPVQVDLRRDFGTLAPSACYLANATRRIGHGGKGNGTPGQATHI